MKMAVGVLNHQTRREGSPKAASRDIQSSEINFFPFLFTTLFFFHMILPSTCPIYPYYKDVERGIDEKAAAKVLERSVAPLKPKICVFTVVQNCFAGLEAIQHTDYDCVIVQKDLTGLNIAGMLKVVRALGNNVPFIHMIPIVLPSEDAEEASSLLSEDAQRKEARRMDYSDILVQPYSPTTLCNTITAAIQYNHTQVAEINRKQQIDRDESERILKFRAFEMGEKTGVLEKPKSKDREKGRKKRPNFAVDPSEYETNRPKRSSRPLGKVLDEIKGSEPPPGQPDPAAAYVRILQSMQGNKGASIRSPIKAAEQRPLTSSEETAQFLAEMANK